MTCLYSVYLLSTFVFSEQHSSSPSSSDWPSFNINDTDITLPDSLQHTVYNHFLTADKLFTPDSKEHSSNPFSSSAQDYPQQRSSAHDGNPTPHLCQQHFTKVCFCKKGEAKISCNLKNLEKVSTQNVFLPRDKSYTKLELFGGEQLKLTNILTKSKNFIDTLVIMNIGQLEVAEKALNFSTNGATVILGNIGAISFRSSSVVSRNTFETFAIVHSTIERPHPQAFNFHPNNFLLHKVKVSNANKAGLLKSMFKFEEDQTLDRLEIANCDLGQLNFTFAQGAFNFINISNNILTLDHEKAMNLRAVQNLEFRNNVVQSLENGGKLSLGVESRVSIENNTFENYDNETHFDILDLEFGQSLQSVQITNSNLGRIKSNFMLEITVSQMEMSFNSMKLDDGENILAIVVKDFIFSNNQVSAISTEAFNVQVSNEMLIVNNTFEHIQDKTFQNIRPQSSSSKLYIINNTLEEYELGFEKLSPNWSHVELARIHLKVDCDCRLPEYLFDQIMSEGENKWRQSLYCDGSGNTTFTQQQNIFSFGQEHCSNDDQVAMISVAVTAGIILVLVIICLFFQKKQINKIRRKATSEAVKKFMVPASSTLEHNVEELEQAQYLDDESVPDLLSTVPENHLGIRKNSIFTRDEVLEDVSRCDSIIVHNFSGGRKEMITEL